MAVDSSQLSGVGTGIYGPIEPLTLAILHEELNKLHGTLTGDVMMDYDRCLMIADGFISELGSCINLSISRYGDDKPVYDRVFDGLQDVLNLMHGHQDVIFGPDGKPRLLDHQEARIMASDCLEVIMTELSVDVRRQESRPVVSEPRKRPKEGVNS